MKTTKEEKIEKFVIIFFLLTILSCGLLLGILLTSIHYDKNPAIVGMTPGVDVFIDGYYSHEGYYCVLTKGQSPERIVETDYHEMCHALIHNDYEHFCMNK